MGLYATWFIATAEDVGRTWQLRTVDAINPFTRELSKVEAVEVDEASIAKFPHLDLKFLLVQYVELLFGAATRASLVTPDAAGPYEIWRIPDAAVRALVEEAPAPSDLFAQWQTRLTTPKRVPYAERFDEDIAMELFGMARAAVGSARSLYGFVR